LDIKTLQEIIVDALDDIKARDIAVFDTTKGSAEFDRVIIATADVARQTKAMALNVIDKVKGAGGRIVSMEGGDSGEWVLVDCGDAIVHIMQPAVRQYYNLEELWGQKKVKVMTAAEKAAELAKKVIDKARAAQAVVKEKVKQAVGKVVAKKAPIKKVAAKKPAAKKPAAKKPAAKKPAAKKPAVKKVAAKKAPAKKAPAKAAVKKAAPKKAAVKKAATKKAPVKKPAVKKPAAKVKKPAAKTTRRAAKP
jgi:ribosome-associated protein